MVMNMASNVGAGVRLALRNQHPIETTEVSVADGFAARRDLWQMMGSYYDGTPYDSDAWRGWPDYIAHHKLPAWIRGVYNPVRRAVDWYAGHLYRGGWTEDGRALPDGTPHLIPIAEDVWTARPQVIGAMMQGLTWSNWRTVWYAFVADTMLRGSGFVEIMADLDEDDPSRSKVKAQVIPLWQIHDLELNAGGDVKRYVLAYTTTVDGKRVAYRKEVDGQNTRVFHDDKPQDTIDHGYGFCPGVWVAGILRGNSVFGVPLLSNVLPKIDQINATKAHVTANVARRLNQPMLLIGDGDIEWVSTEKDTVPRNGRVRMKATEGGVKMIRFTAPNGRVQNLLGDLDMSGVNEFVNGLIEEVESDLPEIVLDKEMRQMSQVTGPGARAVNSDVRARYEEAMGNFDAALVKIMQMIASIGCHHAHNGDWGEPEQLTRQQRMFLINETVKVGDAWVDSGVPVSLESFERGALAISLNPRPLIEDVRPVEGTIEFETMMEARARRLEATEALTSAYSLTEMEVPTEEHAALLDRAQMDAMDANGDIPEREAA